MSKVGGTSFLLWAMENYQEFSELAHKIAEKEVAILRNKIFGMAAAFVFRKMLTLGLMTVRR